MVNDRPQTLYRMRDKLGELLYIGRTATISARLQAHRDTQLWWRDVATIELEHFDSPEELAAAETTAIRSENPRFNVADRADPKPSLRKTPQRTIVVEPAIWDEMGTLAREAGTTRADALRACISWYNRRPYAKLPQRPGG